MQWYDRIAKVYDLSSYWFYEKKRKTLINGLDLKKGDRILIIACGTGQNFSLIENKIGKEGQIIAVDISEGMLNQAKKRIVKNNWKNIILIHKDVRKLNVEFFENENININFDIVLGELAFSVIPDWKKVINTSRTLLKEHGKIGLLDWHREQNDLITKTVDYFAESEIRRETLNYTATLFEKFEIKEKYFFDNIYVAIGEK